MRHDKQEYDGSTDRVHVECVLAQYCTTVKDEGIMAGAGEPKLQSRAKRAKPSRSDQGDSRLTAFIIASIFHLFS
jgi:hypothetical protein